MFEDLGFNLGLIIGIILILITLFVHRHTFVQDYEMGYYKRLRFPIWLVLLIICIGLIPFINYAAFIIGGMVYLMKMTDRPDFVFSFKNISGKYPNQTGKLGRKIKNFFNKSLL